MTDNDAVPSTPQEPRPNGGLSNAAKAPTPEIPAPPTPEPPAPPAPEVPAPSETPDTPSMPEIPAPPAPEPSTPSPQASGAAGAGSQAPPPPPPPRVAPGQQATAYAAPVAAAQECPKSKVAAGLFAILLGSFGVHKFYLGYVPAGLIMAGITVISLGTLSFIPAIIGVIEGILYLTKSDAQFCQDYYYSKKAWF